MATRDKKPSAFAKTGQRADDGQPAHRQPRAVVHARRHEGARHQQRQHLRFAFNRTAVNRDNDPFFDPHDLGINVYSYVPHQMIVRRHRRVQHRGGHRDARDRDQQLLPGERRPHGGARATISSGLASTWRVSTSIRRRGRAAAGQWNFNGQASGLGLADFLLGRVATLDQSGLAGVAFYQWYRRRIRAGHLARVEPRDRQRRPALGAVLQPEPDARRQLDLRAATTSRRTSRAAVFNNAPAGLIYPGDPGFPEGDLRAEQEVVELLAARRRRVGRARRRPHGRALVVLR